MCIRGLQSEVKVSNSHYARGHSTNAQRCFLTQLVEDRVSRADPVPARICWILHNMADNHNRSIGNSLNGIPEPAQSGMLKHREAEQQLPDRQELGYRPAGPCMSPDSQATATDGIDYAGRYIQRESSFSKGVPNSITYEDAQSPRNPFATTAASAENLAPKGLPWSDSIDYGQPYSPGCQKILAVPSWQSSIPNNAAEGSQPLSMSRQTSNARTEVGMSADEKSTEGNEAKYNLADANARVHTNHALGSWFAYAARVVNFPLQISTHSCITADAVGYSLVSELKRHMATLDHLLQGEQDQFADEELARLRSHLRAIFQCTEDASMDVESAKRCLNGIIMIMMGKSPHG